jgi:glycosyltransferase involved in cell wall biosynthesis
MLPEQKFTWPSGSLKYRWQVNWHQQCALVIPCLNEASQVGEIVKAGRYFLPTVLVVDDGSDDGTASIAQEHGAICLSHPQALGKAEALKSGFRWARSNGFQWVVTLDGDGQHAPADIPAFLRCAEATSSKLVIGNRMWNSQALPLIRRLANRWSSQQLSRITGRLLPDCQCGFRLVHLPLFQTLPLKSGRYLFESEFVAAAAFAGENIQFVNIQVIYGAEKSKIRPIRDSWTWLRWWWHLPQPHSGTGNSRTLRASSAG